MTARSKRVEDNQKYLERIFATHSFIQASTSPPASSKLAVASRVDGLTISRPQTAAGTAHHDVSTTPEHGVGKVVEFLHTFHRLVTDEDDDVRNEVLERAKSLTVLSPTAAALMSKPTPKFEWPFNPDAKGHGQMSDDLSDDESASHPPDGPASAAQHQAQQQAQQPQPQQQHMQVRFERAGSQPTGQHRVQGRLQSHHAGEVPQAELGQGCTSSSSLVSNSSELLEAGSSGGTTCGATGHTTLVADANSSGQALTVSCEQHASHLPGMTGSSATAAVTMVPCSAAQSSGGWVPTTAADTEGSESVSDQQHSSMDGSFAQQSASLDGSCNQQGGFLDGPLIGHDHFGYHQPPATNLASHLSLMPAQAATLRPPTRAKSDLHALLHHGEFKDYVEQRVSLVAGNAQQAAGSAQTMPVAAAINRSRILSHHALGPTDKTRQESATSGKRTARKSAKASPPTANTLASFLGGDEVDFFNTDTHDDSPSSSAYRTASLPAPSPARTASIAAMLLTPAPPSITSPGFAPTAGQPRTTLGSAKLHELQSSMDKLARTATTPGLYVSDHAIAAHTLSGRTQSLKPDPHFVTERPSSPNAACAQQSHGPASPMAGRSSAMHIARTSTTPADFLSDAHHGTLRPMSPSMQQPSPSSSPHSQQLTQTPLTRTTTAAGSVPAHTVRSVSANADVASGMAQLSSHSPGLIGLTNSKAQSSPPSNSTQQPAQSSPIRPIMRTTTTPASFLSDASHRPSHGDRADTSSVMATRRSVDAGSPGSSMINQARVGFDSTVAQSGSKPINSGPDAIHQTRTSQSSTSIPQLEQTSGEVGAAPNNACAAAHPHRNKTATPLKVVTDTDQPVSPSRASPSPSPPSGPHSPTNPVRFKRHTVSAWPVGKQGTLCTESCSSPTPTSPSAQVTGTTQAPASTNSASPPKKQVNPSPHPTSPGPSKTDRSLSPSPHGSQSISPPPKIKSSPPHCSTPPPSLPSRKTSPAPKLPERPATSLAYSSPNSTLNPNAKPLPSAAMQVQIKAFSASHGVVSVTDPNKADLQLLRRLDSSARPTTSSHSWTLSSLFQMHKQGKQLKPNKAVATYSPLDTASPGATQNHVPCRSTSTDSFSPPYSPHPQHVSHAFNPSSWGFASDSQEMHDSQTEDWEDEDGAQAHSAPVNAHEQMEAQLDEIRHMYVAGTRPLTPDVLKWVRQQNALKPTRKSWDPTVTKRNAQYRGYTANKESGTKNCMSEIDKMFRTHMRLRQS